MTYYVGNASFPLADPAGYIDSTADPLGEKLLDLLKTSIRNDVQSAYAKASEGTPIDGYVIEDTISFEWEALMHSNKLKYPVLSLHRAGEATTPFTQTINHRRSDWTLEFIMNPMDQATFVRLSNTRNAVLGVLNRLISRQSHEKFNDGYNFFDDLGLESLSITETNFESVLSEDSNFLIPRLIITLRTTEKVEETTTHSDFDGTDIDVSQGDLVIAQENT